AYNCPGQIVVSGNVEAVKRLCELATQAKARCVPLNVSAPFHCSLLQPAADKLAKILDGVEVQDPKIPYIANVDAKLITSKQDVRNRLVAQVCKPVLWEQSLMNMFFLQTQRFIEVGPGRVCVGHLKKVERRKGDRASVFAIT